MQKLAEFKQEAQAAWAAGDYDAMMRQEGLYEVGARLVRRLPATRSWQTRSPASSVPRDGWGSARGRLKGQ
jgi:hypothetical protein